MKLDNTITAVVTGGASGLGAATARALASHGVKVGIFDMNAEKGEAIAAEIGGAFANVNVTSDDQVDAGFEKIRAALGQERILVNCAGTGNAAKTAGRDRNTGEIKHFPLDRFDLIIQINLVGTFRCIAKSAAGMLTLDPVDGERGAIVNTASVAAEDGQMGQAAYSASKGGVVGMTLPIARDLAREFIRVNTILPGIFDTPLMQGAPDNVKQ
ncbi:MAG: SDR family NAD(P)-dependent oxidoreductase, partial [Pseudomonadota bacterium]